MANLVTEQLLPTDIKNAWQIVGDFKSIELWVPTVSKCDVTGTGKGMTRTVTLKDGQETIEQCTDYDAKSYRLQYTIIQPDTIKNYLSTIELEVAENQQCLIRWSAEFDAGSLPEEGVKKALSILYHQSLAKLTDFFEQQKNPH